MTFISDHPTFPIAIALAILLLYLAYLHYKLHLFTRGVQGASLEETIRKCIESVAETEKHNELISQHALSMNTRLSHSIRNVQIIRYKAFETNGSNQSFSVALLNEKGNGVIISSLHAHERVSTFAKPVEKYKSTYDLTEEELHVIEEAKKGHKSIN
jgi:hypothetical protein